MSNFIVAHRKKGTEDPPEGFYKIEEVNNPEVNTLEAAVREALTKEQILHHEFTVYEVSLGVVHSDEFKHAGVFDDIGE